MQERNIKQKQVELLGVIPMWYKKTWNQLNAVITSRFSSGTQNYLT